MFRPVLLIAVQLLIVVGFWTSPAWGQSEARHIQTVTPLAIQRGKTITVTMTGENLQTATAVHFYRRGLAATGLKPSSDGRKLTANLKVAARCPLGQHPFRVRTRDGWTIMLTLYVSAYPVVSERRQPSTFENCQLVKNNSSVSGYVSKVGEVDYFRVAVKKGQRLSVDVQ